MAETKSHAVPRFHPACFLVRADKLSEAVGMYPFDTGAFVYGAYDAPFRGLKDVEPPGDGWRVTACKRFELDNTPDTPKKVVKAFYGENAKYYNVSALQTLQRTYLEARVEMYHVLMKEALPTDTDSRRSTIEVHFGKAIPLTPEYIERVIVSSTAIQSSGLVRDKLADLKAAGIEVQIYDLSDSNPSGHNTGELNAAVRNYYMKRKYLSSPSQRIRKRKAP